jgi:dihydrofolate reductase
MTVTYTWDVFSTVDGYGSYEMAQGDTEWGGYWGKQGPELLARRAELFRTPQRMVYGATTFREVAEIFGDATDPNVFDEWNVLLQAMPATVVSSTLTDTLGWPDATIERGDAVDVVRRLKADSAVPLRSQASLSLNRALLNAGEVDRIQLTVFPVISGRSGTSPIFFGLADLDLDLLESRTLDGRTLELTYRPTLRG